MLDPALDNKRAGWITAAEIRGVLRAVSESFEAVCKPPDMSKAGDAHRWGPCGVERCMLSVHPTTAKQTCVPRKREYDLHARRRRARSAAT